MLYSYDTNQFVEQIYMKEQGWEQGDGLKIIVARKTCIWAIL